MLVRLSSLNFLPIRLSALSTWCWEPGRQKDRVKSHGYVGHTLAPQVLERGVLPLSPWLEVLSIIYTGFTVWFKDSQHLLRLYKLSQRPWPAAPFNSSWVIRLHTDLSCLYQHSFYVNKTGPRYRLPCNHCVLVSASPKRTIQWVLNPTLDS